ncbi:MAG: hypothetical protein NTY20_02365 [Candidatus Aenigmarchaeota archaeon]|jgi:hypothetical protein|nr:hypothetical protein [Candidatus Aenigmarchaeota archaeon]
MEFNDKPCIPEATRLAIENGKGSVYYVMRIGNIPIDHAYYVPDETKLDSSGLNQSDNGYPQYPRLKVWTILKFGTKYF